MNTTTASQPKFPFQSEKYDSPKYKGLEFFANDRESAREQARKSGK